MSLLQKDLDDKVKVSSISSEYPEWDDLFSGKINADLIIQGSSRAWVHVNPAYLDSVFGIKSYNLGMAAYQFDGQFTRYKCYIDHNKKPKVILQCLDFNTLDKTTEYFQVNQFIPYWNNKEIRSFLKQNDQFSFFDFEVPLYKYRWMNNNSCMLAGLLFANKHIKDAQEGYPLKLKGFKAQNLVWGESLAKETLRKDAFLNESVQRNFIDFVHYCKSESIELILVYPPEHRSIRKIINRYDTLISNFHEIAKDANLTFLDYSNDSICSDSALFYDRRHLNSKGVVVFNKLLANDLRLIMGK